MVAALPLAAQSPSAPDESAAAAAGVPGLSIPTSIPKLPSGFFVQDATIFSSALFQSLPASGGFDPSLGSGWQSGLGFTLNGGWTKATPRNTFSVLSSTAFTGCQGMGQGRNWNEYLNASVKRLNSARLRSELFAHLVITDQQQFLFGETQSGEPGENRQLFNTGVITTPAAANLLLVQQNLLASAGGQVWYDYGPRTTLSLEGEVVRNQAIGSADTTASGGVFTFTSESATGSIAYTRSRRSEVDFSLSAIRTMSPFDTSVFGSALAAYSYAVNDTWFARVRAGISVGSSSRGFSSMPDLPLIPANTKPEPIGGVSLEYHRNLHSVVVSTNRGVTEVYGGGAAIIWSSSVTWNAASAHSPWSFFLASGYDLSSSEAQEHVDGWRANGGVNRTLSRLWSASCQYAFLSNSFRFPQTTQGMHSHGLRLALVWTPAGRSHL